MTKDAVHSLLEQKQFDVFPDADTQTPFCAIAHDDSHVEYYPIRHGKVRGYIYKLCKSELGRAPSKITLDQVLEELESLALFEKPPRRIALRIDCKEDGTIVYDLADQLGGCVHVTPQGWTVDSADIAFKKHNHTLGQVTPSREGDLEALWELLNLPQEYRLLLLTYLVSSFVPGISHPILLVTGQKGSAKTTFTRILRDIIDPSTAYQTPIPKNPEEFSILASQHWCLCFDNIDRIKSQMSDILCTAVTGEAFTKRGLYTNDTLLTTQFKCCVLMNGISVPAQRTDLLDRIIWLPLKPIGKEDRKSERAIWEKYDYLKPKILGGVFDTLSKAMKIHPAIPSGHLHRMADFDLWGRAVSLALGYKVEDFSKAMEDNISRIKGYVILQDSVAIAVQEFLRRRGGRRWQGTATELLQHLGGYIHQYVRQSHAWPKSSSSLSAHLDNIADELLEIKIHCDRGHDGQNRYITLTMLEEGAPPSE